MVHAHDEGGGHVILGGGGDDDLPGAIFQVGGGGFRGGVGAGGFDDVLGPAVIPGDVGGVGAAVDPDLLAVDATRPMRPKPLMPTLIAISILLY